MFKNLTQLALIAGLSLSLTGCGGCTRVSPGYVGIKTVSAGTGRGVQDYPATTGWVFYNPLTENIMEYPTFTRTAVWTHSTNEGKAVNEEITFSNKDSMQIAVDISIAYQLNPDKVPHFYVKFRHDDLDFFTHGFLRNITRDKLDQAAGKYTIDQIMGDNAAFIAEARRELEKELAPIGVEITQFGIIGSPRPPQAVVDSINLKVQANQIALQKQIEVLQAEAEAKKSVAHANGYSQSLLIKAEAEAKANREIANSISPTLVEWKKLDKWDGKLPTVSGGGSGIILSVPQK